jgi:hypothetical protein
MERERMLIVAVLVIVVLMLTPLAYASPPDPTYVAGMWDDADYDDVVILASSSSGATHSCIESDLTRSLVVVALVSEGPVAVWPVAVPAPNSTRAPPAD